MAADAEKCRAQRRRWIIAEHTLKTARQLGIEVAPHR
jgi:hypothetical protein